jgi:hypothetical protein
MPTDSRTRSSGTSSSDPAVVGHRAGVLDQRLDAAQALGEGEQLGAGAEVERGLTILQTHRDHPAEPAHLPGRDLVPRMPGEPWVEHGLDRRMRRQEVDDRLGVVAVLVHADREGLGPAHRQVGVERSGHAARAVLQEREGGVELGVVGHQDAADDIGVSADVLGGGVQHDVRAQRERLLEVRRGEGVVDHEGGFCLASDLGDGRDVADVEQGIGRRLDPDRLGLPRRNGRGNRIQVGQMRRIGRNPPSLMYPRKQPKSAAVRVVWHHEMATR